MSEIPGELRYTSDHEWVRQEPDGSLVIGITDHAQAALGELVYVELPQVGQAFRVGEAMAVVESTKAASDVYAPIAGEVLAVNEALTGAPELANQDPYRSGWLARLKPADAAAAAALLSADDYRACLDEAPH